MGFAGFSVTMETPVGTPLADALENVGSWLSARKIDPTLFQSETKEPLFFWKFGSAALMMSGDSREMSVRV
jgi:hypothetical protein